MERLDPFANPIVSGMCQAHARMIEAEWLAATTEDADTKRKIDKVITRLREEGVAYSGDFEVGLINPQRHYQRWEVKNPVMIVPLRNSSGKSTALICDRATHRPLIACGTSNEVLDQTKESPDSFFAGSFGITAKPNFGGLDRRVEIVFATWQAAFVEHSDLEHDELGLIEKIEASPDGPHPVMLARAAALGRARMLALAWCGEPCSTLYNTWATAPLQGTDKQSNLLRLTNPKDSSHALVVLKTTFEPLYCLEKQEGKWVLPNHPDFEVKVEKTREATAADIPRLKNWLHIERRLGEDLEGTLARIESIQTRMNREYPLPIEARPRKERERARLFERKAVAVALAIAVVAIGVYLWKAGALDWARKRFAQADASVA